jgi:hypothetical protein
MSQDHPSDRESQAGEKDVIRLPAPTAWPIILAFGVVLMAATVVTNIVVGCFGFAILLAGAVGWWHDVFPADQHEDVALAPEGKRVREIQPRPGQVDHLKVGEAQHRVRLPESIHPYSAGVRGGIAGGVVMAIFAVLHGVLDEDSFWFPVNLLAAVVMPGMADASLEQLKQFNGLALTVCLVVHGLVSVLLGLLYGVILPMLPSRHFLWGAVVLPLMWTGIVGATLGVVNPVLSEYVDWPWFIAAQVAFGLVTGLVVLRSEPIATLQTWPLGERAGLEGRRAESEDRS